MTKALFFAAATKASASSHSERVILPSLFVSIELKNPLITSAVVSSFEIAPSPFESPSNNRSNGGGLIANSSAAPGDQAAKYSLPSEINGDAQDAVGIPRTNHFSSPLFRS